MDRRELFRAAQEIAEKKVRELNCPCVIQSGSSLRKEDFAPGSDVDLLAIYEEKVDERWGHDFEERVEVSVMKESKEEFLENLEAGNPFELMALRFGEVKKDDGFLKSLKASSYEPTERTFETWIRSGLNQYSRMLEDRNLALDFHNAAYQSFRSFSRVLILENLKKLLEQDENIKECLAGIDKKASDHFWSLREGRFEPPKFDYVELEDLEDDGRFQAVKKVEYVARKVLSERDEEFPSFGKLKELVEERGYRMLGSFLVYGEKVHISGVNEEDHEIFEFDLQSGDLKALEKSTTHN